MSAETWANWLAMNHAVSTVKCYRWEVAHAAAHFGERDLLSLGLDDLTGYLAARRVGGVGDEAIKRSVNALKSFYLFHNLTVAVSLPMPRPKRKLQRTLTADQAFAVLAACDTSSPIGLRDLALVALMLDSGLRAAEVCRLRVDCLDLETRLLRVVVKGGQEMFGTYSEETANYLSAWAAVRFKEAVTVFTSFESCKQSAESLTTNGLRILFRRLGARAGLKAFSPHDLRRTFATLASLMGAPSRLLQVAGRWHNLVMVERYTPSIQAKDFARYSPVAGLFRPIER